MTDLGSVLGLGVAFAAGVVSFASPCCLPLVPAYLSYMVGATGNGTAGRRTAFTHGLAFTAGFSLVFVALFLVLGALGAVVDRRVFSIVGGALLVVMGLQTAGVINIRALWRDTRLMPTMGGGLVMAGAAGAGAAGAGAAGAGGNGSNGGQGNSSGTSTAGRPGTFTLGAPQVRPGYGRSLAFGLLFAAGWSPCIGPILGGILGLATASTSLAQGTILLLAYAAGLAVPFLAIALGASWVARRLTWVGRHHQAVSWVTGGLLVLLGVLMLTNMLGRLAAFGTPFGL